MLDFKFSLSFPPKKKKAEERKSRVRSMFPFEIWKIIIGFIDSIGVARSISFTNKTMMKLCDEILWKPMFLFIFPESKKHVITDENWRQAYLNQLRELRTSVLPVTQH